METDEIEVEFFNSVRRQTTNVEQLRMSLKMLCDAVYRIIKVKPIVLIDEYDDPINRAYGAESLEKILEFLRTMLSSTLKSNDSLKFAVVTGVMQIAKESVFSGLNNPEVYDVFREQYDDIFGFTGEEVRKLCDDFGNPDKYEEAREWYDGYLFGSAEMYNPWSMLKYVSNGFKHHTY